MNARTLDELSVGLQGRRRYAIQSLCLAAAAGALAAILWTTSTMLALALAAGAAVELVLVAVAIVGRRWLIEQLALEPEAYALPEVKAFGAHLLEPRASARLAASIRSMLAENARLERRRVVASSVYYLRGRVAHYSRELEAIAADLLSPAVLVQPVSIARCRWLLTQAAESPLYNPRIPVEDLGVALRRIRDGMERPAQP